MTVFLAPQDPLPLKKRRDIIIHKANLYKSVESITQKHVDASGLQDARVKDALAADTSENLDGYVLGEHLAFRDAELRKVLQTVLEEEPVTSADDTLDTESASFHYPLQVDGSFRDAALRPLALYMHRYLVYGALYDWYSEMGLAQQAQVYGSQLSSAEGSIRDALKGPSIVKRPLQPFGPAKKMPV